MIVDNSRHLSISNITFGYKNNKNVLTDISVKFDKGQMSVIAGPNGSGKTTLMMLVFDLLEKQKGNIEINGIDNKKIESKKNSIYLPSDNLLPDFLSGKEYIELMCKLYDFKGDETLLNKLCKYYNMEKHMDKLIESYSHGMTKKIQLIVAFFIQPDLIVIDETLNGIDLEAKEVSKVLIKKIAQKGKTMIMCTHDLELAQEIGNRAILMFKGRVFRDVELKNTNNIINLTDLFKEIVEFRESDYEI